MGYTYTSVIWLTVVMWQIFLHVTDEGEAKRTVCTFSRTRTLLSVIIAIDAIQHTILSHLSAALMYSVCISVLECKSSTLHLVCSAPREHMHALHVL